MFYVGQQLSGHHIFGEIMSKWNKLRESTPKSSSKGTPLIVLAALATGAISFYFIGFLALQYKHPIHWALAIVGGIVGWLLGKLIYRLRGETDIL
jgi:hypothetical protein